MEKNRIICIVVAGMLVLSACSAPSANQNSDTTTDQTDSTAIQSETTVAAEETVVKTEGANSEMDEYYTFELSENVNREHVSYKNRYGITLAGDLYTSKDMDDEKKYPALVIGAPYGGVKEQGPGVWANELAQRGFIVLTFDPSYNGYSGGEPRHVSSPEIFSEDFSAGVDFLGVHKNVERTRIGAVGICGSGGFALSAAQMDTRIKAVVTASIVDVSSNSDGMTAEERRTFLDRIGEQRWADFEKGDPDYAAVYADEPLTEIPEGLDPLFAEFFTYYGMERGNHPNADGNFTTTSQAAFMNYSLLGHLETISPRPVLMIAGENAMTRGMTETIYERIGAAKELVIVPDANHVDLYDDVSKIPFDRIAGFFNEGLK